MNQTTYERGLEKGLEQGRRAGQLELVCGMLEEKFGARAAHLRPQLEQRSLDELRRLGLRIGLAASLADLGLAEPETSQ